MQNTNNKAKANGGNVAAYRGLEPVEPGNSEIQRSVVADRGKTSARRERTTMPQSQMATNGKGERISTEHPSSPPGRNSPLKFSEKDGDFKCSSFAAAIPRTFGTSDKDVTRELFLQVIRALPATEPLDPHGNYALAALYGISPRDTLEGMLSTQMVAAHNLAMEFLRRAAVKEQPPAGVA
jgi:hypothetical protein